MMSEAAQRLARWGLGWLINVALVVLIAAPLWLLVRRHGWLDAVLNAAITGTVFSTIVAIGDRHTPGYRGARRLIPESRD
jgi:hypothetical protein